MAGPAKEQDKAEGEVVEVDKGDEDMGVGADKSKEEEGEGGGGKAKGKGRRGKATKKKTKGGDSELWKLVLKSLLQQGQQMRLVSSALLDTIVVKSEGAEAVAMLEQGKAYAAKVREEGSVVEGPPHPYVFGGLLAALKARGESIGAKNLAVVQETFDKYDIMDKHEKNELIRVCRCDRTFHSEHKKIVLGFGQQASSSLRQAVLQGLVQTGGDHKLGRAPASSLERELQAWLESMRGVRGKATAHQSQSAGSGLPPCRGVGLGPRPGSRWRGDAL